LIENRFRFFGESDVPGIIVCLSFFGAGKGVRSLGE